MLINFKFNRTIKETFESQYEKSIEEIVCKETNGSFEKTLMSILALCRDDSCKSPSEAADELCSEGTLICLKFSKKLLHSFKCTLD